MSNLVFLGIDVSKLWIDAALDGGSAARFDNNRKGFAKMAKDLNLDLACVFAVVEATGGYEAALIAFLIAKGATVHRAMPLRARSFLRSLGGRGKTDAIDAVGPARYALERHAELPAYVPPSETQARLDQLAMRREDLVRMRAAEKARAAHPRYKADAAVKRSVKRALAFLDAEIAALEAEIDALVESCEDLRGRVEVAVTIKGVGKRTARALLAFMPELGFLTRRAAGSLAGCAPHPRDSGLKRGRRTVFGGREAIRRALFLAAMAARRSDPAMRAFFERLQENGKPKMVALVAVMRKMIVILNARIRDHEKAKAELKKLAAAA